jgi:hypothetical protein
MHFGMRSLQGKHSAVQTCGNIFSGDRFECFLILMNLGRFVLRHYKQFCSMRLDALEEIEEIDAVPSL